MAEGWRKPCQWAFVLAARPYLRRKITLSTLSKVDDFLEMILDSDKTRMTRNIVVGVLALQGAFYEHFKLLEKASLEVAIDQDGKWEFVEVRTTQDLQRCDALIIPGGESTTVSLVAARSNLLEPLRTFVKQVYPSKDSCHLDRL